MKSTNQTLRCQICLAKHEGTLPIQLAFRLLGVHPDNQETYHVMLVPSEAATHDEETWFERGWSAGVDQCGPAHQPPFEDNVGEGEMIAWLVGYVAGSYASLNGWATPSCKYSDPSDHLTNSLPLYMTEVERVGKYPIGCLGQNMFTRDLMQVLMDNQWSYVDAAETIRTMLAAGKIEGLPIPRPRTDFDPNPTVYRPNLPGAYAAYIKNLEKRDPTWFWYEPLDGMAPEMQKVATERRLQAIGEPGYKGTDKPTPPAAIWGPWGAAGRPGN